VIDGFLRALAPGGYLIVSATELSQQLFAPFEAVRLGGATLYRKPDAPRSLGHAPGPTSAAAPVLTAAAEQRYLAASSLVDRHPAGHPGAAPGAVSGAVSTLPPASATPAPVAPPGAADLAQRARAHADEGRLDQAQACCAEALSLCPTDPSLHYLDAVIGQSLGHTPAALEALRRAIYLEPRHVLAHFTRAHLLREAGHEAAARRHFATTAELLAQLPDDAELAEAGGVTAGNLAVVVAAVRGWQPQGVAAGNG
jgi:chemotaxis protein methyltransferase CheR